MKVVPFRVHLQLPHAHTINWYIRKLGCDIKLEVERFHDLDMRRNILSVYRKILQDNKCRCYCSHRHRLTNGEVQKKRVALFDGEKERQMSMIRRIEKISVEYRGVPEECTLIMNKGLSTPFNCAMHLQELLMRRSVVALVNGELWDMHRPLTEDCELTFLHFEDEDPRLVNKVFWRACSFILGYVLERAFKDNHHVQLCSFPPPDVKSGSFVYDADLDLPNWQPTQMELNCLSRIGTRLQHEDLKFDRLEVKASLASEMFEDNRFKSEQIPEIAAQSGRVTLYRLGDHIDISKGPMMSTTAHLARYTVTAVHDVESDKYGPLKRVQGLAIPQQLNLHYWTYNKLVNRASKLNTKHLLGHPVNTDQHRQEASK
ncbi:hypothetical protein ScPMuIL_002662 [Solemya velum]